jgi:hypothetical protein
LNKCKTPNKKEKEGTKSKKTKKEGDSGRKRYSKKGKIGEIFLSFFSVKRAMEKLKNPARIKMENNKRLSQSRMRMMSNTILWMIRTQIWRWHPAHIQLAVIN